MKSKEVADGTSPKMRSYDRQQRVLVRRNRPGKERWTPETIVDFRGPSIYIVRTPENQKRFVHANHLWHDNYRENKPEEPEIRELPETLALDPVVTNAPGSNTNLPTPSSVIVQNEKPTVSATPCTPVRESQVEMPKAEETVNLSPSRGQVTRNGHVV